MPTLKSRRCPLLPRVLSAMVLIGGTCGATGAHAQAQDLFLEVLLNRVAAREPAAFALQGATLAADAATLRGLGLRWPGSDGATGLVPLDRLPGLAIRYDAVSQQLHLSAPVELLDRPVLRLDRQLTGRAVVDPATRAAGLVVNYDLYAQHGASADTRHASFSGLAELRLFGVGPGTWRHLTASRASRTGNERRTQTVRLETSWQQDYPDDMVSFTVGDTVTGALSWSRPIRIGGLRLARAFSLQPYRSLLPVTSFQGSAVLPSTVDLFINGMRQSTQQVPPGEFQLASSPTLNGAGQANVVITDINGQRRVLNFDLYAAPELLQEGLSDWSLDFGAVRRDYGEKSSAYDRGPVFSASARHGLTVGLTVEAHAQATAGLGMAGVGGAWLPGGGVGVFSASLAASRRGAGAAARPPAAASTTLPSAGLQRTLGYQYSSPRYSVSLSSRRAGTGFADAASLHGTPVSPATDSAYLGITHPWGQFGLGLVRQGTAFGKTASYLTASWSRQVHGDATLSVNLNRAPGAGGLSAFLALTVPLGHRAGVSLALQSGNQSRDATVQAWNMPSGDEGGWGWRAQGKASGRQLASGQAEVNHLGPFGQWAAGLSQWAGASGAAGGTTVQASAGGGLVLMGRRAWATRRIDDALALVSTNGFADVPVRLGNRAVGKTDEQGLLVAPLYAYQRNQVSIDTLALSADMRIVPETMEAVPDARSGIHLRFPLRRVLAVQLALRDAAGAWIPAGSVIRVTAAGDPPMQGPAGKAAARLDFTSSAVVGYDGLVYLEDPAPEGTLHATGPDGPCRALLQPPPAAGGTVDLGVVTCR